MAAFQDFGHFINHLAEETQTLPKFEWFLP